MKVKQFRLLLFLLVILILVTQHLSLLYYLGVMWLSVEFLNSREDYISKQPFRLLNLIFGVYTLLIVINRTRTIQLGSFTEGGINIAEHSFFGIVICLKIWLYGRLWMPQYTRLLPILSVVLFNSLGVFNEVFQNWLTARPLFHFIPDAQKDMVVNFWGSVLFLVGAAVQKRFSK